MLTVKELGKILLEELNKDKWGDIRPHWLVKPEDFDEEEYDDAEEFQAMEETLERVVQRLNKE